MKRFPVCLLLVLCLMCPAGTGLAADSAEVTYRIATFSISGETMVRDSSGPCGQDEYLAIVCEVKNTGNGTISTKSCYVRIDGRKPLNWAPFTLDAGQSALLHVYWQDMRALAAGDHSVSFYINGRQVHKDTVAVPRSWNAVMEIPSKNEIRSANRGTRGKAPYLGGFVECGYDARYTEYSIDFRADYLPNATYVCGANWFFDLSELEKQYARVELEGPAGYGGLQKWEDGTTHSIMSLWDIFCKDSQGRVVRTIRPTRVYPAAAAYGESFGGEGTGAHYLGDYSFRPGVWYRQLIQCGTSETTGCTEVTESFCDLSTGVWTRIATYDLGVKNVCFNSNPAIFLENFNAAYAGEVRTAEYRNIRIRLMNGQWKSITAMTVQEDLGWAGSYAYGSDGRQFYLISTGAGDSRPAPARLTVKNQERGQPY